MAMHCPSAKELAFVLAHLHSVVETDSEDHLGKRSPDTKCIVKQALQHLRAGALEILFREPPRTPLIDFAFTTDGLAISPALYSFVLISNLVRLGYRKLWVLHEPEDAVWPRVFKWIGYLLPFDHGRRLSSFPPLFITQVLEAMLCVFEGLRTLPSERARSVVLSGGHDAIHDIVALWLNGPALIGDLRDANGDTRRRERCFNLLHTLWRVIGTDTEMRAILVVYIMRAVKGHPHRLFRILSSHIDTLGKRLSVETWTDMNQLLRSLIPLATTPELRRGGFPRCIVLSTIAVMRTALADCPGLCVTVHDFLCTLCFDPRSLLVAVDHGLFTMLVELRAKGACEQSTMKGGMSSLISCALITPRAVKRFHNALPEGFRLSERSYHPDEQALLNLADERFALLQEFDQSWGNVACCASVDCTASITDVGLLRACPCGEALYCSRTCQRTNWYMGHQKMCALKSAHPEIEPLKPRDVEFLRFLQLAESYLTENYTRFVTELNAPPIVTLDLSLKAKCVQLQALTHDWPETVGGGVVKTRRNAA
ncbi:hypothetical protein BD626DRAFT_518911 [Schizophyllum amplum]|uniref:MYND-type domain-containing protein n=1 Tax=Schizophyllum amplum TaxID=97359 RepID=A0A550BVL6_9AGAR|nr:hypothetical protein BD626DRAFT_518911 [Auriculariopsis ampla]